jgi:hypothetical protein
MALAMVERYFTVGKVEAFGSLILFGVKSKDYIQK